MGAFQGYLTNTGCQAIGMAQFVQIHCERKALLYPAYKYLMIRDGEERTFWRCEGHKSQIKYPSRVTTYEGSVQCTCDEGGL